jgi:hypothetical protein
MRAVEIAMSDPDRGGHHALHGHLERSPSVDNLHHFDLIRPV